MAVFSIAALAADPVDINTASAEELTALANVGASRAQAIVEYREQEGDFPSVSALVNVSGIGPATLEQNRDRLTVME
ncbi:MAG: helix-hairpin-helix domain-containing protein [Halofilum sp. (in: g-proteobacteria)]